MLSWPNTHPFLPTSISFLAVCLQTLGTHFFLNYYLDIIIVQYASITESLVYNSCTLLICTKGSHLCVYCSTFNLKITTLWNKNHHSLYQFSSILWKRVIDKYFQNQQFWLIIFLSWESWFSLKVIAHVFLLNQCSSIWWVLYYFFYGLFVTLYQVYFWSFHHGTNI